MFALFPISISKHWFSVLLLQASMDLPPDKAKLLKSYDFEKKWDIICDQVCRISNGGRYYVTINLESGYMIVFYYISVQFSCLYQLIHSHFFSLEKFRWFSINRFAPKILSSSWTCTRCVGGLKNEYKCLRVFLSEPVSHYTLLIVRSDLNQSLLHQEIFYELLFIGKLVR